MSKLRAGIIGCGQIAGGYNVSCEKGQSLTHACSYQLLEDVELVAISDPSEMARNKFSEKWQVANTYANHEEMLQKENLDIVSVCSPTEYHLDAFRTISRTNSIKGVFCEKPLSYDFEEAQKIVELAKGKVVSLNYFRRWNLTLQKLREDLKENKYGSVQYITVRYTKGLLTNGSHLIDLLYWIFGKPINVVQYYAHSTKTNDPGIDLKLSFLNGSDAVFLHIPNVSYTYIEVDIFTDMGKISIKQRGQNIEWSDIVIEPNYNTFNMLKTNTTQETEWRDCLTRALKELIHVITNGGRVSCTPIDGIVVSDICKRAIEG